jgi:DNA-binding beta-propeller fold protein YncE
MIHPIDSPTMHRLSRFALAACALISSSVAVDAAEPAATSRPVIETVAGDGRSGELPPGGGAALAVPVDQPFGVELGPDGALYIASVGQHRVLRLDREHGIVTSVAGSGVKGYAGDGQPATQAQLNEPYEIRFDVDKNLYFVEMQNHLIRRVDSRTGLISTVAGAPTPGFGGDGGAARQALFRQPHSIALDERGYLYVADIGNHRIRRINLRAGTIDSIAGDGNKELPRDGAVASGNPILGPRALAIVGRTMWIALREGNSVWRLDLDSLIIRHVAGSGRAGYGGDGGSLKLALFNGPKGIAATPMGWVYVVDSENQAIRLLDTAAGSIETIAGGGPQARGFAGDKGTATSAQFDRPHGIGLAPDGSFFIGDTNNHRVRWVHR